MIDSTPRLLGRPRLQRLVSGLRERQSSSTRKLAEEVEQLRIEIQELESQQEQQVRTLREAGSRAVDQATTAWDETLHTHWDSCEKRAFNSIHSILDREQGLRAAARQQADQITAEAKQRVAKIESRFMHAKNVPLVRLREIKAGLELRAAELRELQNSAETLLAQRSERAPAEVTRAAPLEIPMTSQLCLQKSDQLVALAREQLNKLTNNGVSRFLSSAWLWIGCAVCAMIVGVAIGASQLLLWPVAAVVGLVVAVILAITAQIVAAPLLRRITAVEYPKLRDAIADGMNLNEAAGRLAVQENDAELKRIAEKRDTRFGAVVKWREHELANIQQLLKQQIEQVHVWLASEKQTASQLLTQLLASSDTDFAARIQASRTQQDRAIQSAVEQFLRQRSAVESQIERIDRGGIKRMQSATQKAIQIVARSHRWCQSQFPNWSESAWMERSWPPRLERPILPVGSLSIDSFLPEAVRLDAGKIRGAPVVFDPILDKYLTFSGDPAHPVAQRLIRNLILRALTTLPAGKTQVCIIDPPGLGRDYGWLMHLADFDPQLVMHRVWTQPAHIAKQIEQLAFAAEDFIQQSLRNQYSSIVEYNRDAGSMAEPYRLLVWNSFPAGLDEQSWKSLQSLLDTGSRCGIIPILMIDPSLAWPIGEQREQVMRRGMHLKIAADDASIELCEPALESMHIEPPELPEESQQQWLVEESGRQAILAARVEVPLESIVPPPEARWQADSSKSLEIPIGQSGVGRIHAMRLGIGTAQHAIIAGKTGSGKSTLLHAIITSAAVKYSPDKLRMVLLDFKKGVEFQVYGQGRLPHADIIGIESHREFGLSALEYVDRCLQFRGQMFREAGVQDVASWNLVRPDRQMPRVLIVVDEFQELFVEDDKLSNQASLILDRIVRQGRSFGVHAILSSQTLAGAYSLPRTTLGQMAVRVALQCDAADAQMIFAEDNPAASRLKHPGQAVYNDAGGRIEGNQSMQIGWLTQDQQIGMLASLPQGYRNSDPSTNMLGRTVVYEGNRAATWSDDNANLAIEFAKQNLNPAACWCVLGESVAISPAVTIPLTNQAGRNLLIVGTEDAQAASVMHSIAASFVRHFHAASPKLIAVQGAKPTDARSMQLGKCWQQLTSNVKLVDTRGVDSTLSETYDELKRRIEKPDDEAHWEPILLALIQIGRMRSLRREDEFGMSGLGESTLTPDKHLEELLRDGPSHGIHLMIWAENTSTVNRWLNRTALREIEVRILMQMGANDSTNLIDSISAAQLSAHVMLAHDDATSTDMRFRPFDFESLQNANLWAKKDYGAAHH